MKSQLRSYLHSLFTRDKLESSIAAELRSHIELHTEDLERTGLPPAEALRRARIEFGGLETHKADIRHSLGLRLLDELRADLRYAIRMLRRSPGFTTVAVASLALGIGANTIIFTLAKGILLDRLAVPQPNQLRLFAIIRDRRNSPLHSFWGDFYKTLDGHADVVSGQLVSGNFYQQFGVQPALGRAIQPSDDTAPGSGPVAVISDGLWGRLFGRSPSVIGKTIQLNLIPITIVGVNPPGFTGASSVQLSPDVFLPFSMQPPLIPDRQGSLLENPNEWWMSIMGRARPGVSQERLFATLTAGFGILALILACIGIYGIMAYNVARRTSEIGIRMALGARSRQVLLMILRESSWLAILGVAAGLAAAFALTASSAPCSTGSSPLTPPPSSPPPSSFSQSP